MIRHDQKKYALMAYALTGEKHYAEIAKYLQKKIGVSAPEHSISRCVAQNREVRKNTPYYYGSWYIQEGNGSFRLACNDDLESRLLFVKNAKYGKNGENVFSKSEFRNILCEFMDKDPSLNTDLLDDVWSKLYI